MARPLRIEYPGALYHVTSRGDRREDIFVDDADRQLWLAILATVHERMHWHCYAYCLMDNHYHLVIETPEANLAKGMRHLNGVYTQRYNRRHQRVGHVFQGRYKAIHIDRDNYLLEAARYVVLNPVRAGFVAHASQWRWSSYLATSGQEPHASWLCVDRLLALLGKNRPLAHAAYRAFVRQGIDAPLWTRLHGQIYLGDDKFVSRLQSSANTTTATEALAEIPLEQRIPPPLPLQHYRGRYPDKREAMARAYANGHYTMKEIGRFFGVHYSTVSRCVKKHDSNT